MVHVHGNGSRLLEDRLQEKVSGFQNFGLDSLEARLLGVRDFGGFGRTPVWVYLF
jgi:hypothetical protein